MSKQYNTIRAKCKRWDSTLTFAPTVASALIKGAHVKYSYNNVTGGKENYKEEVMQVQYLTGRAITIDSSLSQYLAFNTYWSMFFHISYLSDILPHKAFQTLHVLRALGSPCSIQYVLYSNQPQICFSQCNLLWCPSGRFVVPRWVQHNHIKELVVLSWEQTSS